MVFQEEFDYQILRLSDMFYKAYPNPPFTEILLSIRGAATLRQVPSLCFALLSFSFPGIPAGSEAAQAVRAYHPAPGQTIQMQRSFSLCIYP